MSTQNLTGTLNPTAQLTTGVTSTVTASAQASQSVTRLLALAVPPASSPAAADINTARAHAQSWIDTIQPQVKDLLSGVVTFGQTFDSDYALLRSLANKVLGGDTSALTQFKALVAKWQTATQDAATKASAGIQAVSALETDLQASSRALAGDNSAAVTAADAAQNNIKNTQQQIAVTNGKIAEERLKWGILLGPFVEELIHKQLEQVEGYTATLNNYKKQLAAEQAAAQQATATAQMTTSYGGAVAQVTSALQTFSNGWATLNANFGVVQQAEEIGDFSVFTPAQLHAAKSDWDNLVQHASQL